MPDSAAPELTFREVTKETWQDFERFFESRGSPSYCWCMPWRDMPVDERKSGGKAARKTAISQRVGSDVPIGILGYSGSDPVAWCSIAPRATHRKGLGGLEEPGEGEGEVWSLTCFFISRLYRGKGLTRQLITAAIDHARMNGARVVEAYPIDPESPSYRFMGYIDTFKSMGFTEVGRAGTRRYVVRLNLPEA